MILAKVKTKEEKLALDFWDEYYKGLQNTAIVDTSETEEDRQARIKRLEADDEAWFMYYFEKYCTAQPADFHKRSTARVMNSPEWFEVRPWSRELAKSGRTMMELIKLHLTGKKKLTLIISNSKDNAEKLLKPYKLAFEKNPRIINDYGRQEAIGSWSADDFTTLSGNRFIAVGAGQSPRGVREEEIRPDSIVLDDFDTDEECRNPDIIDKKWEWWEQAVYGTRSISNPLLVIFNGNIIAENCCIKKAMEVCDKYEIVNIRDKNGRSSWPAKNTEEMIDRALSKISTESGQKEYFNNPISLGKVFNALNYCKMQPLNRYKFLVLYTDPSYKKNADTKGTSLIGKYKDEYHVLWVRNGHATTAEMIEWQFQALEFVDGKTAVYQYIEWPAIDDTIKREIKIANARHNITLALKADERSKPDKYYRIESNLEPLNRNGKLLFNEKLKGDPHMKEMETQFKALSSKSRYYDDGPDCVEGGVWIINHKNKQDVRPPANIPHKPNKKRF